MKIRLKKLGRALKKAGKGAKNAFEKVKRATKGIRRGIDKALPIAAKIAKVARFVPVPGIAAVAAGVVLAENVRRKANQHGAKLRDATRLVNQLADKKTIRDIKKGRIGKSAKTAGKLAKMFRRDSAGLAADKRTYTVEPGDFGTKIAQSIVNDGSRWRELKAANPDIAARPDPHKYGLVLRPGDVLTLPASWLDRLGVSESRPMDPTDGRWLGSLSDAYDYAAETASDAWQAAPTLQQAADFGAGVATGLAGPIFAPVVQPAAKAVAKAAPAAITTAYKAVAPQAVQTFFEPAPSQDQQILTSYQAAINAQQMAEDTAWQAALLEADDIADVDEYGVETPIVMPAKPQPSTALAVVPSAPAAPVAPAQPAGGGLSEWLGWGIAAAAAIALGLS